MTWCLVYGLDQGKACHVTWARQACPDQDQHIPKARTCTQKRGNVKKAIRFPFLLLSVYFTAECEYPHCTNHWTLVLKAFPCYAAQHCIIQMFYCFSPCKKTSHRNTDGLMLICLCFGLQQLCQSFQSMALGFFPDIWAILIQEPKSAFNQCFIKQVFFLGNKSSIGISEVACSLR